MFHRSVGWIKARCAESTGRRYVLALSLVVLSLFMFANPALAAIAFDNASSLAGDNSNQTSLTWSHTVGSGSNRILIVGVSINKRDTTVSSVAYGGSGLTLIGAETNGDKVRVELWKLVNPATGTANITVTLNAGKRIVGGAVSFTGVDQTTPHGAFASAGAKSTSPSVAVSSAAGELVIDALATKGDANGVTLGGGQTQRWNAATGTAGGEAWGAGSTEAGAASVTMSWALAADKEWALGAISLKPAPATISLSGTVFEDVNYGGGAGRSFASSGGSGRSGATVELYNALGVFVTSTTTNASGVYTFTGQPASVAYTVRVVNSTVTSSRTGYVAGLLPVQTFRTSGLPLTDANRVGGEQPHLVDAGAGTTGTTMNTSTGAFTAGLTGQQAQSIGTFTAGVTNVSGIDFGFNFDTIVATRDTGQGSLRQFITNANALGGEASLTQAGSRTNGVTGSTESLPSGRETSIFMIPDGSTRAGLRAGLTNQLTSGVAQIAPASGLPALTGANAIIDGGTQSYNVGNTNTGILGAGGTVGVDAITTVQRPEVRIQDGASVAMGLDLAASTLTVRGIAIYGFGNTANGNSNGNIHVGASANSAIIEQNVIGTTGATFADPGTSRSGGDNGIIRNNLIGFSAGKGIGLEAGSNGWQVLANESRGNGIGNHNLDGIDIETSGTATVVGNLLAVNLGVGIDSYSSSGGNVIRNNTVTGNGIGTSTAVESAGVRVYGTGNTVDRNIISGNVGAAVLVTSGASNSRITRNSIFSNGPSTGEIGIDLQSSTDNSSVGTSPFVTLNDAGDSDTGANGLLNYPVLLGAVISGSNLSLSGYARPGSVIELFTAAADPSGFGEGQTYLTTLTEGSGQDSDANTGTYGPAAIHGVAQGTDTTNRFQFSIATPAGVTAGTVLTATATVGTTTSEFSGNATVVTPAALTSQKTVQVVSDPVNGTTNPKAIPGAFVAYTIAVNHPGASAVDADTVVITDAIPASADLFVGNLGVAGSGPVAFINGSPSSGLSYTFTSLASTSDDVSFSNNGGTSFVYTPSAGANGIDAAMTHIRINPKGMFNGNSSFQVMFRVRVE